MPGADGGRHEAAALGLDVFGARAALHVLLAHLDLGHLEHRAPAGEARHAAALESAHEEVLCPQVAVRGVVRVEEEPRGHRVVGARARRLHAATVRDLRSDLQNALALAEAACGSLGNACGGVSDLHCNGILPTMTSWQYLMLMLKQVYLWHSIVVD